MLTYLRITNLALMDAAELEFDGGYTAVTGETGAGKSVLLGALSLLSGSRGDKALIRQGEDRCEVEASLYFEDTAAIDALLAELDIPACEEGVLLIQRTLNRSKAPKFSINGRMTTLANMQTVGEAWIDFHGPGEPQKLLHERWQLELLDAYAKAENSLATYHEHYHAWRGLLRDAEELRSQEQLSPDEIEFIQKQLEQFERLELTEEAIEELERDYTRLSSAEELTTLASQLEEGLRGDEGISNPLAALIGAGRELADIDSSTAPLAERLESLAIEIEDLAQEFGALGSGLDFDEEVAQTLREQMEIWMQLRRKYGPTLEAVIGKQVELAKKVSSQGDIEGALLRLEKAAADKQKQAEEAAEKLRQLRVKAAAELSKKAAKLINALGFKKAHFSIDVIRENQLSETGNSRCQFMFAPNAGQEPMPLNKIGSSGEVARVMLALKAVLARVDATPVLVFDEVDANVGGEIAKAVADELAALGNKHQVFVVTHLPQVAAKGQSHYVVEKHQSSKSTKVTIEPIHDNAERRLKELARMLGDRESATALQHARELLES